MTLTNKLFGINEWTNNYLNGFLNEMQEDLDYLTEIKGKIPQNKTENILKYGFINISKKRYQENILIVENEGSRNQRKKYHSLKTQIDQILDSIN